MLFGSVQYRVRDSMGNGFYSCGRFCDNDFMSSLLLVEWNNGFSTSASDLSRVLDGMLLLATIDWPSER